MGSQHRDHPLDLPRRAGSAKDREDQWQIQTRLRHVADSRRSRGAGSPGVVGVMLVLWRRHEKHCKYADDGRDHLKCRCPIWLDWRIGGKRIRKPIGTRDWQNAQRISRDMEATGIANSGAPLTTQESDTKFIAELAARSLRQSTIRKHELMQRTLQEFCKAHGYIFLRQLGIDQV